MTAIPKIASHGQTSASRNPGGPAFGGGGAPGGGGSTGRWDCVMSVSFEMVSYAQKGAARFLDLRHLVLWAGRRAAARPAQLL
jgi:hypothetical protein